MSRKLPGWIHKLSESDIENTDFCRVLQILRREFAYDFRNVDNLYKTIAENKIQLAKLTGERNSLQDECRQHVIDLQHQDARIANLELDLEQSEIIRIQLAAQLSAMHQMMFNRNMETEFHNDGPSIRLVARRLSFSSTASDSE